MLKYFWSAIATVGVLASCYISNASPIITTASVIGVLFVLGVAFKNAWTNLLGAALTLIYGYLSYSAGYYANALINVIVLFPLQLVAFWFWRKTEGKTFTLTEDWKRAIIVLSGVGILISCTLTKAYGSHLWIHDGVSAILVIVATFLLMLKVKEQWYAWIPYNALEVFMWFMAASLNPDMLAIFVMRSIFFANSLIGAYEWFGKKSA